MIIIIIITLHYINQLLKKLCFPYITKVYCYLRVYHVFEFRFWATERSKKYLYFKKMFFFSENALRKHFFWEERYFASVNLLGPELWHNIFFVDCGSGSPVHTAVGTYVCKLYLNFNINYSNYCTGTQNFITYSKFIYFLNNKFLSLKRFY